MSIFVHFPENYKRIKYMHSQQSIIYDGLPLEKYVFGLKIREQETASLNLNTE